MPTALYDTIGKTYDTTRRADPDILSKILKYLSPTKQKVYLDVGCGSGNYTSAIFEQGFNIQGIDISTGMLEKAKAKNPNIKWLQGDAMHLPLQDKTYDGAICILATHHIQDIDKAFKEVYRILKKGRFVLFTAFPEQMLNYWLVEYFPKLMRKAADKMSTFEKMSQALSDAGFEEIREHPYFIKPNHQDCFLHAGKYRPEIYLDPSVRAGISTFALEEDQKEILLGCEQIQADILSGRIKKAIQSYESDLGDYSFIVCQKG